MGAEAWNSWPGSAEFTPDEVAPFEQGEYRDMELSLDDPRVRRLASDYAALRAMGDPYLPFLWVWPRWTPAEEQAARAFHVIPLGMWHGGGCVYQTLYDHHLACPLCLAGDRPASPLILPHGRLPKRQAASVLGHEAIVTRALALRLAASGARGLGFVPVLGGWREYREMLAEAGLGGIALPSRDATQERLDADAGLAATLRAHRDGLARPEPEGGWAWYELDPPGRARVSRETRAHNDLTKQLAGGDDQCPCGGWLGGAFERPLGVEALEPPPAEADLWLTRERFGWRRGVFYPARELIASPMLARELREALAQSFTLVPIL
jgi:hypothetical protein